MFHCPDVDQEVIFEHNLPHTASRQMDPLCTLILKIMRIDPTAVIKLEIFLSN